MQPEIPEPEPSRDRIIGRVRNYLKGKFGPWRTITTKSESLKTHSNPPLTTVNNPVLSTFNVIELPLHRNNATLRFYPNILPPPARATQKTFMETTTIFRQYKFGMFDEPRVHVMLSSTHDSKTNPNPGYRYHGVNMKSLPLRHFPAVHSLATSYANSLYGLPNWSIGVDLVCYRDGLDSIGWHADDTARETTVLCVVVESDDSDGGRPVFIRPDKKVHELDDGDEEVQLYLKEGNGYELDEAVQKGYEHSLPKKKQIGGRRMCMIFRQGEQYQVPIDSGVPLDVTKYIELGITDGLVSSEELKKIAGETVQMAGNAFNATLSPAIVIPQHFGHPQHGEIREGDLYSRAHLFKHRAHSSDQRGVSGNLTSGADAIIVSRQDPDLREADGFTWLRYTSSRRQGGGGLATSFLEQKPIRVFRSSSIAYGPTPTPTLIKKSSSTNIYRYDGLYNIEAHWDEEGEATSSLPISELEPQHTFLLRRCLALNDPSYETSTPFQQNYPFRNLKTGAQLWDLIEIEKSTLLAIPAVDETSQMNPITTTIPVNRQTANPVHVIMETMLSIICGVRGGKNQSVDENEECFALLVSSKSKRKRSWLGERKMLWMQHRRQMVTSVISVQTIRFEVAAAINSLISKLSIMVGESMPSFSATFETDTDTDSDTETGDNAFSVTATLAALQKKVLFTTPPPKSRPQFEFALPPKAAKRPVKLKNGQSRNSNWIDCRRCRKWRLLHPDVPIQTLADFMESGFLCSQNQFDYSRLGCRAAQLNADEYEEHVYKDAYEYADIEEFQWLCCDAEGCRKWRLQPPWVKKQKDIERTQTKTWKCCDNLCDPARKSCSSSEIDFEEYLELGLWKGKVRRDFVEVKKEVVAVPVPVLADNWVSCDKCKKWRLLGPDEKVVKKGRSWAWCCADNKGDLPRAKCRSKELTKAQYTKKEIFQYEPITPVAKPPKVVMPKPSQSYEEITDLNTADYFESKLQTTKRSRKRKMLKYVGESDSESDSG